MAQFVWNRSTTLVWIRFTVTRFVRIFADRFVTATSTTFVKVRSNQLVRYSVTNTLCGVRTSMRLVMKRVVTFVSTTFTVFHVDGGESWRPKVSAADKDRPVPLTISNTAQIAAPRTKFSFISCYPLVSRTHRSS